MHGGGAPGGQGPQRTGRSGRRLASADQVDGIRQSTAVTYLKDARRRPNFELRPGVTVDRVEVSDCRARGVTVGDGERIDADLVVLCAGRSGVRRSFSGPVSDPRTPSTDSGSG